MSLEVRPYFNDLINSLKWGAISKILAFIKSIVIVPIVIDSIGVNEFSNYIFYISIIGWTLIVNFGIPSEVIYSIKKHKNHKASVVHFFMTKQLNWLVLFAIVCAITLHTLFYSNLISIDDLKNLGLIFLIVTISWMTLPIQGYLNSELKLDLLYKSNSIASLASILLIYIFSGGISKSYEVILIVFMPAIISNMIIASYFYLKDIRISSNTPTFNLNKQDGAINGFFVIEELNLFLFNVMPISFIISINTLF